METDEVVRNNEVLFEHGGGYQNWTFEIGQEIEHCITNGQTWKGMAANKNGENTTVCINAGRKNSKKVAEWFKTQVEGCFVCDSFDKWPEDLNFAVKTTLTFTVGNQSAYADVIIAQGHNARSRNNWWLGFCKKDKLDALFDTAELRLELKVKPSGVNTFILSLLKE